MKIGDIILSTRDYTYDGRALKESIATFNVTINASISDSFKTVYIPVVLSFRITHNITATTYKYGVTIDWSTHKDFPFKDFMKTGDNFTLLGIDGFSLSMDYPPGSNNELQLGNFSTTAENDTAIFLLNGVEYAREYVTTDYLINGTELHNTTRIYFYNFTNSEDINVDEPVSNIFVLYDGFKYNQSTGFISDPFVIIPCSEITDNGGIPWSGLFIYLIGLLALFALISNIRRKRTPNISVW